MTQGSLVRRCQHDAKGRILHAGRACRFAIVLAEVQIDDRGNQRRKQRWITFRSAPGLDSRKAEEQAKAKLAEVVAATNRGDFCEPSRITLIEWLQTWLDRSVKPPMRRPETYRVYGHVADRIAKSPLATIPLQRLQASDLERYYATLQAAHATVQVHRAVLHRALKQAMRDRLLNANPAALVERPSKPKGATTARAKTNCWSVAEARQFLSAVAKEASPQLSAFCFLALDSGARKSELAALKWSDVDLDAGEVVIERQLDKAGREPVFGPPKTGRSRTVTIGPETVQKLRAHKASQAALRLKNGAAYENFGLVFAREHEDLQRPEHRLGGPLKTLSGARFRALVAKADVPRISPHGLRHTVATTLLGAGVPVHVVAARLGHRDGSVTLSVYAHALPTLQQEATARLSSLLHG
jgi:integrase